jgi:uncharacterized iron-regulated protein
MRERASSLFRLTQPRFGEAVKRARVLQEAAASRCVIFGELHSIRPIVSLQVELLQQMADGHGTVVHVVLEHFSLAMQPLLDDYMRGDLSFDALLDGYAAIGTEGHALEPYSPLFEHAVRHSEQIRLRAGFIPRSFARMLMTEGEQVALETAKAAGYLGTTEALGSSEAHYSFFESLISGRDLHGTLPPSDRFRKMFPAQVIKDASMAHTTAELVRAASPADKFLLLLGVGHMAYGHGVPERLFSEHPQLEEQSYTIYCRGADHGLDVSQLQARRYRAAATGGWPFRSAWTHTCPPRRAPYSRCSQLATHSRHVFPPRTSGTPTRHASSQEPESAAQEFRRLFGAGTPPAADVCFAFEAVGEVDGD